MKVAILAGGLGTRLAEETVVKPKPMVEIGGSPILLHIMRIYAAYGHREFVIGLGYKGEVIKDYFLRFYELTSDLTVYLRNGTTDVRAGRQPDWAVHLVDTGSATQTGGRIKRLCKWIGDDTFMATYGDGLSDVDIRALVDFHRSHGKLATVTAVRPPARYGALRIQDGQVRSFVEKPQSEGGWINGGFFVFEPQVLDLIDGDDTPLESTPLERLVDMGQLMAYQHDGFWQPMDTLRDKNHLESLWASGKAPWKVWE